MTIDIFNLLRLNAEYTALRYGNMYMLQDWTASTIVSNKEYIFEYKPEDDLSLKTKKVPESNSFLE